MRNLNFKFQVYTLSGGKIIFPDLKFSLSLEAKYFFPSSSFHSLGKKFFPRECGEFKSGVDSTC